MLKDTCEGKDKTCLEFSPLLMAFSHHCWGTIESLTFHMLRNIPVIYCVARTLLARQKAKQTWTCDLPHGVTAHHPAGFALSDRTMVTLCTEAWFTGDTGAPPKAERQSVQNTIGWEGFLFTSKWEASTLVDGNRPSSIICPLGGKTQDVWIDYLSFSGAWFQ